LIFALGIRHVGEVAANDLARHFGSWAAFIDTVDHAAQEPAAAAPDAKARKAVALPTAPPGPRSPPSTALAKRSPWH
jgi:DNA ligase (NAD+)